MTTATIDSTVINRETVENLDGTNTEYTYFEPTEEKMKGLAQDLFSKNWNKIVVGPCVEGAVFEIRFAAEPKLSYLDGYLTVDLGHWHFHLCLGPHKNCPSEELRKNRPRCQMCLFRNARRQMRRRTQLGLASVERFWRPIDNSFFAFAVFI